MEKKMNNLALYYTNCSTIPSFQKIITMLQSQYSERRTYETLKRYSLEKSAYELAKQEETNFWNNFPNISKRKKKMAYFYVQDFKNGLMKLIQFIDAQIAQENFTCLDINYYYDQNVRFKATKEIAEIFHECLYMKYYVSALKKYYDMQKIISMNLIPSMSQRCPYRQECNIECYCKHKNEDVMETYTKYEIEIVIQG
jgi:hypothetical protein